MTSRFGGGSYSSPGRRSHPHPSQAGQLPAGYLAKGYFDEKGNPLPEIIIDWPQQLARALEKESMTSAQLRNFFGELRKIESQLVAGKSFSEVKARIYRLAPLAANAVNKEKVPPIFKDFIEKNLQVATKDEKSFLQGFLLHFESLVGYFSKK